MQENETKTGIPAEGLHAHGPAGLPHHGADAPGEVRPHRHENTKAVLNRLSRIIGHLKAVRRMVEDERDCAEILVQLAAVRAALDGAGKVILQDHMQHCVVDAVRSGDLQSLDELCRAIDRYIG